MAARRWSRSRLVKVLSMTFGQVNGRLDYQAVADAMGVTVGTVRRWTAGTPRSAARIPAKRLAQLIALTRPEQEILSMERAAFFRADGQIRRMEWWKGKRIPTEWKSKHWTEPHWVGVVELATSPLRLRQIGLSRTPAGIKELRRRGKVVDEVTAPTLFHARLVLLWTLHSLDRWRYRPLQGPGAGETQTWLGDAPSTDLARTGGWVEDLAGRDLLPKLWEGDVDAAQGVR